MLGSVDLVLVNSAITPRHSANPPSPTQVTLESFIDLLCPDCQADYPVLQSVAAHYGPSKLQWRVHFFPLPYHTVRFLLAFPISSCNLFAAFASQWSFMATQAAHTIKRVNGSDAAYVLSGMRMLWRLATSLRVTHMQGLRFR